MHAEDIGAAVCVGERGRDGHLAARRWIGCLELDHFHNLFVLHEPGEAAVVRVGVRGRFAAPGRRVVIERDPVSCRGTLWDAGEALCLAVLGVVYVLGLRRRLVVAREPGTGE